MEEDRYYYEVWVAGGWLTLPPTLDKDLRIAVVNHHRSRGRRARKAGVEAVQTGPAQEQGVGQDG